MSTDTSNTTKQWPIFWILFIGSLVVFALLLLIQPEREPINQAQLPWKSHFDKQGKLHALGLTMHESTLKDAMKLYGKDVEVKLFSHKDESNKTLEAYFPTIYIGTIKAALALRLDAKPTAIEHAYSNGKKTVPTGSGEREVELYNSDIVGFFDTPISSLTLIPRKDLNPDSISKRFGQADLKETQSDGLDHWFFYKLGLEMIIDKEGPEALQYSQQSAKP